MKIVHPSHILENKYCAAGDTWSPGFRSPICTDRNTNINKTKKSPHVHSHAYIHTRAHIQIGAYSSSNRHNLGKSIFRLVCMFLFTFHRNHKATFLSFLSYSLGFPGNVDPSLCCHPVHPVCTLARWRGRQSGFNTQRLRQNEKRKEAPFRARHWLDRIYSGVLLLLLLLLLLEARFDGRPVTSVSCRRRFHCRCRENGGFLLCL